MHHRLPLHDDFRSTYDLVEPMHYLYVRVVKADLPCKDTMGSCDLYAEVRLGIYTATMRHFVNNPYPEWNQVCAFSRDRIHEATMLEVILKDKDMIQDDFMGRVSFDITDKPKRVPTDCPLAPQWYQLEDRNGNKLRGELMLAVWWGTQADEAFTEAWHSDAATVGGPDALSNVSSKVYATPKLWYLRVWVIQAHDLMPNDRTRFPEVLVKAVLGDQALRTKISMNKSMNPMWNEDLMFVVAEPFDEHLKLSVEERVGPNKDKVLGKCVIPLQYVDRRLDHNALINPRWFDLENHVLIDGMKKEVKLASKIQMWVCLEGCYHESVEYSSDLRPTAKQLGKNSIGVLDVGILSAHGLSPMKTKDGRGTTDAYCVAKYGTKWVRTRTIIDSLMPKWNEQYSWEVFDPCTVITIGVFHNSLLQGVRDSRIGKVRIRLSTLVTDRVYTFAHPLLVLHPSGVKKMGRIHLAVRFTYSQPLLPKLHNIYPLTAAQVHSLRHHAAQMVCMRLSWAEPPLRKEVVEYMLDMGSHTRRGKANFFRITGALNCLIAVGIWFDATYK